MTISNITYIDYIPSMNNLKFDDYVDSIYPIEIKIQDTTGTARLIHTLTSNSNSRGWLRTKFYNKRDYFNFPIVNFYLCMSTFPSTCILSFSQMIQYSRACVSYQDFRNVCLVLTRKLLDYRFLVLKWHVTNVQNVYITVRGFSTA